MLRPPRPSKYRLVVSMNTRSSRLNRSRRWANNCSSIRSLGLAEKLTNQAGRKNAGNESRSGGHDAGTGSYPRWVIDIDDIRIRWQHIAVQLDERGRRLLAANEALAHG